MMYKIALLLRDYAIGAACEAAATVLNAITVALEIPTDKEIKELIEDEYRKNA